MVFVTILTPVFNGVEYLEECINSVVNQTFSDWEMLIGVNGHGVDGGQVGIIAKQIALKDSRIKVIIQPPPLMGKVQSLNNLISFVNSEWVCLLDCDDKWHPQKLEKQYNVLQYKAVDASVIGTLCQYFDNSNIIPPGIPIGFIDPEILENFNPIINSSAMIRKELCKWEYNNINFGMEDYYLWTELCLAGKKLYNLNEILTFHRIHNTSAFNSKGYSNNEIRERYKRLRASNK